MQERLAFFKGYQCLSPTGLLDYEPGSIWTPAFFLPRRGRQRFKIFRRRAESGCLSPERRKFRDSQAWYLEKDSCISFYTSLSLLTITQTALMLYMLHDCFITNITFTVLQLKVLRSLPIVLNKAFKTLLTLYDSHAFNSYCRIPRTPWPNQNDFIVHIPTQCPLQPCLPFNSPIAFLRSCAKYSCKAWLSAIYSCGSVSESRYSKSFCSSLWILDPILTYWAR